MVRLAFAVMVEADADVMLVDEVLAVATPPSPRNARRVREKRSAGRHSCSSPTTWPPSKPSATAHADPRASNATSATPKKPPALLPPQLRRGSRSGGADGSGADVQLVDAWLEDSRETGSRTSSKDRDSVSG